MYAATCVSAASASQAHTRPTTDPSKSMSGENEKFMEFPNNKHKIITSKFVSAIQTHILP